MRRKQSPAQRRKAAIGPAFQKWYLTDGMTCHEAHIVAAYRAISELSKIRRDVAAGRLSRRKLRLYTRSAIIQARFCFSIARRNLP